ncbi:MAG: 50S ribosomal protein L18 [Nitrososphaerota archaeon]|jgi:large subunit ribosomal protein L18|nr:50S ribosomal protein L18 [Nitrososphaerota archaeon]MDG6916644.1 50S ribosomal protein L18 [Nitrososphaerota archaeon]MDG6917829.1 50S ribosomal protein L18 [Nitrososphaerota archaeon]MDG6946352.1 50S ribosomal protein L18 [Nitrososphaerota archaeon]MDG6947881.1 50S ribosomal protein L18 [Nitrososphaerota archaeon]
MKQGHVHLLRRRRQGVTDYRARKRAITSQKPLLVVRISNKNVTAQFVKPTFKGDVVLSSSHSRELSKLGWHGSAKSTPACYLLGRLAGKKAVAAGVKEAVVYNGLAPFTRGSRVAALLKGVVDSGLAVPVGEEAYPDQDRLSGGPIAEYAAKLASEDKDAYAREFSALLKAGFNPEKYAEEFEKAKATIAGGRK